MAQALVLFSFGLVLLISGAHLLVWGASQLALRLKIPPLLIGLTIISFGTSAPEIGVCTLAAWKGEGALVIGNIVGSNILNILLVLGISATISPLVVKKRLIWWDVPLMVVLSLIFWGIAYLGFFSRWMGILFLLGTLVYLSLLFWFRKPDLEEEEPPEKGKLPFILQGLFIVGGIALLLSGADFFVHSVDLIAHHFGINELLIGLTLVALGTSLPEIATSIVAVVKGNRDLAVGNVIGSNIFNILAVMGISGIVAPVKIPASATFFDFPIMVATAVACLPIFLTGHKISRWEGILFLFYYALYTTFLVLRALDQTLENLFTQAFYFFILPLTLLTLGLMLYRHFSKRP